MVVGYFPAYLRAVAPDQEGQFEIEKLYDVRNDRPGYPANYL